MDNAVQEEAQSATNDEAFEGLLDGAIQEESCDEVDLTNTDGWQAGIVQNNSLRSEKVFLYMIISKNKSLCDFFLHFLPMQFIIIIGERRFRDRIVTINDLKFSKNTRRTKVRNKCVISFSNYLIIIHIGSVDISNNRRDYLISYQDVIFTDVFYPRELQ
jgi:hypothetical protein